MKYTPEITALIANLDRSDLDWMKNHWINNFEQVFTHHGLIDGATIHVRVTKLIEAIKDGSLSAEQRMMAIPDDLYELISKDQGIERAHIERLQLDDAVYCAAVIIEFDNGEHVIVDGNHRLIKTYELGLRAHPALFVREEDIKPFLLDVPPKISELMVAITKANVQLGDALERTLQ